MDISKCNNDHDYISLVDWTDESPDLFINFINDKDKSAILQCYNSKNLSQWFNDKSNVFALWVNQPGKEMDDMGHGGMPNTKVKFYKTYTGEFIYVGDYSDQIKNGISDVMFDAVYVKTARLGNLEGSFGVSKVHGQAPGYRVYKLISKKIINENGSKILHQSIVEFKDLEKAYEGDRYTIVSFDNIEEHFHKEMIFYTLVEDLYDKSKIKRIQGDTLMLELLYDWKFNTYIRIMQWDSDNDGQNIGEYEIPFSLKECIDLIDDAIKLKIPFSY
jgi:hypothetical protein